MLTTGKGVTKDMNIQTEDFNFIDYDALQIETGEIYMYDRISRRMRKLIIETDKLTNNKIVKQFEYKYNGMKDQMSL